MKTYGKQTLLQRFQRWRTVQRVWYKALVPLVFDTHEEEQ